MYDSDGIYGDDGLRCASPSLYERTEEALKAGNNASQLHFVLASCQYPPRMLDSSTAEASYLRMENRVNQTKSPAHLPPFEFLLLAGDLVYVDAMAGLFDPALLDDCYYRPYPLWNRINVKGFPFFAADVRTESSARSPRNIGSASIMSETQFSKLNAPFPFANSVPGDFAAAEEFQFKIPGQDIDCLRWRWLCNSSCGRNRRPLDT